MMSVMTSPLADGFDVVAVGIEDERAVVGRVVFRSRTGLPVVASAVRDGGGVEGVHRHPTPAGEGHVDGGGFSGEEPEGGLGGAGAEPHVAVAAVDDGDTQRLERGG